MSTVDDELKARMRAFLAEHAEPMRPVEQRNIYGTTSWLIYDHLHKENCRIAVPRGTTIREVHRTVFAVMFVGSENEIGLEATGLSCECRKYTFDIRWAGSLGELIRALTDPPEEEGEITL